VRVGLALLAACGPPKVTSVAPREPPPPEVPPPSRLSTVFVLESGGVSLEDTVVAVPVGRRRMIVLRRGPPDNSLFAQIVIPSDALQAAGPPTDSVRVAVRPRPGLYALDLEVAGQMKAGPTVTFSYAVHFVAPDGARQRYGSDLAFERALHIARVEPDSTVTFLPTTRPGADLLTAPIPGPGRYMVLAPR